MKHEDVAALSGWVIPMSKAMQANNIDVEQALDECGISAGDLENQECRIAIAKLAKVIDYCNARLPRKDFTMQVAEYFHPGMFHALGYAMMSSASLKDSLARIMRYKRIVSDACRLELSENGDGLMLKVITWIDEVTDEPTLGPREIEAFLATLVKFGREAVEADLCPLAVYFSTPEPEHGSEYLTEFFGCQIHFNADINAIVFDREQADKKLLAHNLMLTQSHEKMLDEYLSRIDKSDLANLVRCRIYERLSLGAPTQSEVAEDLGMSLRNMQRKLSDKGTSYKEILENTRKKLALEYIEQPHLSLGEIGYLVGFASVANFNRAFKRWTGSTPGEFRSSHQQAASA
ncbi:AraC family transcriptional regulator [Microbulbifer hainanensis]|uniref:AraC family transcriptional regulator n=1 Tax=Microbulbifer hainanensis TaxID=2735675 RepID=UPI001D027DF7|nr:AraC family transcriptional regulator [Microbulbifer hainanensis]